MLLRSTRYHHDNSSSFIRRRFFCLFFCTHRSAPRRTEFLQALNTEIPQIQVTQGQEPRHFRRMFGQGRDHGRLIVHDRVWRKRDNPEKRVALFKVQRVPDGGFQAFQVGVVMNRNETNRNGTERVGKNETRTLNRPSQRYLHCMKHFCFFLVLGFLLRATHRLFWSFVRPARV